MSASADGTIKIWGTSQKLHFRKRREKDEDKGSRLRLRSSKVDAILLGKIHLYIYTHISYIYIRRDVCTYRLCQSIAWIYRE